VAWKKARRHKLATALVTTLAAAALSLSLVWAKGRRDAAEQARLAQAMGEDVKGMELFLRNAYAMPLHDVERERDIVRQKLGRIAQSMAAAGKVGEGPGHYAMGRGHLALGDPATARAHLEQARAAGYASAALDYALGQALGELYRRAIEETKRISNAEERKKRVAALEIALRDPALARLRAVNGAEVESPAYVEGLIALYEGKNDEALAKARAAFAATPWLYEAKKLEGDARYALGSPFRHDGAFDWEKMNAHFRPAAEAYRAAAEMARSDPEVHRAECELWEKIGFAEAARGAPAMKAFDTASAACGRAVEASHADARARVQRALVLAAKGSKLAQDHPEEALPVVEEAVRAADEAVRASPGEVMAVYASARALSHRAQLLHDLGREVDLAPTIAAFEQAIAQDPRFTWAESELGDALVIAADIDRRHGRDPREALTRAAQHLDRALALDPAFTLPLQKRVKVYVYLLQDDLDQGKSSEAAVGALFNALDAMEKRLGTALWASAFFRARALRLRGLHELALGQDPRASTRASLEAVRAFAGPTPRDAWLLMEMGECHLLDATSALRRGEPTRPALDEARAILREAARVEGEVDDDWRALAARVELVAIREATRHGEARAETFEAALSPLRPALAQPSFDPGLRPLAAEIHARRAAWAAKKGDDPQADLDGARALADAALEENPHLAGAFVARGLAALVELRRAAPGSGHAAATSAREAFDAALRENPRLAADHADALAELAALTR
jgi:serine/threonine-protein kinase